MSQISVSIHPADALIAFGRRLAPLVEVANLTLILHEAETDGEYPGQLSTEMAGALWELSLDFRKLQADVAEWLEKYGPRSVSAVPQRGAA